MSRYELQIEGTSLTVAVGWDPPLQTFFGIVYDPELPEEDEIRLRRSESESAVRLSTIACRLDLLRLDTAWEQNQSFRLHALHLGAVKC